MNSHESHLLDRNTLRILIALIIQLLNNHIGFLINDHICMRKFLQVILLHGILWILCIIIFV